MSDQKGLCALCGAQAALMCQRCFECYCSVNCQIEDWAKHKLICTPMPTLIPLQSMKHKRISVNARLDRSNFSNNSMEVHTRPSPRNFQNFPLRKPQWCHQNEVNTDSENAINSNLRKIEQKIPLSPPEDESVRSHQSNRTTNNWRHVSNDRSDMPGIVKYGCDNNKNTHGMINSSHENKNEGPFTNKGSSIDFSLKLRNRSPKAESVCATVDDIIEKLDDVLSSNNSERTNKSRKAWRTHFAVQKDKFFEVIVQYISESDPTLVWVVDANYEAACTGLLKEINKHIKSVTEPCSKEMLYVGSVVAAPFFGLYYRAIILEEKNPLNEVRIRLIDYGNDFYINVNQLKAPITVMQNVNAYAFCIRCSGKVVEIGDVLKIKMMGNEDNDVYKVVEEIKEEPPKDMNVKIINIFQKIHAIAVAERSEVSDKLAKMREVLTEDTGNCLKPNLPAADGLLIAGKTSTSWERGFIISSYEANYLIYCIDIGEIVLLNEIKSVPSDFKNIPRQAVLFTLEKEANLEKYWNDGTTLQLKPITKDSKTNYELFCKTEKLAGNVKVSKDWNGCFADISIEYWPAGPKPNIVVQITHVNSHSDIYVCKHDKVGIYSKIFDKKGQSAGTTEAKKGKIVLGHNKDKFVRCKVVDKLSIEVLLSDLDSGNSFKVLEGQIKEADNFVKYAPVFVSKATLLHLSKITPCISSNMAIVSLRNCIKEETKFTISFSQDEVELFDANNTSNNICISFNKLLIPLLFEEVAKNGTIDVKIPNKIEETNNIKEKIEEPSNKREIKQDVVANSEAIFQINDIELLPIPTGQQVQILVLDDSMIGDGLITGCVFNPELLKMFQTVYAENIMKFCLDPSIPQEYSPRELELCFSIYEEDNQWYRAVCLKKNKDDEFLMLFLDYGNTTLKTKKDLRKMSKDFMYPSPANTCVIEGLPQAMSEDLLKSIKSVVYTDALLKVSNVTKVDDSYLINIEEVKKLLP